MAIFSHRIELLGLLKNSWGYFCYTYLVTLKVAKNWRLSRALDSSSIRSTRTASMKKTVENSMHFCTLTKGSLWMKIIVFRSNIAYFCSFRVTSTFQKPVENRISFYTFSHSVIFSFMEGVKKSFR